ncbi:hypothetical protein ZTR_03106 [Talaromyces verruculosus]|nr:hypothetical protein ZTR_03106 [Talaromyces verruculosus]
MRLVSIVPRQDGSGTDLQFWDLPKQLIEDVEEIEEIEEPCRLLELPLEVMTNILHQIEDKADLYALLCAAPRLYNVIIPVWWKHLTINLRNDRFITSQPTDLQQLVEARSPDLDRLQFVKSIVVEGTCPPLNWCVHRNRIYGKFFVNQSNDIAMFVRHLKPNSLKHFSWTTATCMADSLIAPWGCLTTLQRDLEELRIVLSAKCPDEQMNLYLGSFRKLKYLSVRGLRNLSKYPNFYHGLKAMMLGSCATLKEFELAAVPDIDQAPYCEALEGKKFLPVPITKPSSSVPWEMSILFHHPWPYSSEENFFPAQPVTDGFLFPNLRVLHLEMVKLTDCANRLIQTIDVASMTSLTLRHCQGWDEFLLLMAQGTAPMSLRKLELEYYEGTLDSSDLINMLNRCANIEDVAICDADEELPLAALQTWKSVCRGRPSLRRFVHHQADHFEKADWFTPTGDPRRGVDVAGGDEFLVRLSECISSPDANPFTDSNLEFLGICSFPTDLLVGLLRPLSEQTHLRVIHFRKSAFHMNAIMSLRRALDHFVRWAFGFNGIPSLEVVLFGDYSAYHAKKGANCRYNRIQGNQFPNWEVKVDPDISDLPVRFVAMAKACPGQFTM